MHLLENVKFRNGKTLRVVLIKIHSIFKRKLGIRRVRGREWASDRVGRENMTHQENMSNENRFDEDFP